MWRTSQRPVRGRQFIRRELRPRLDEDVSKVLALRFRTVIPLSQMHGLEVIITFERGDFGARVHRNPWIFFDAPDQVSRHGLGQAIGSYEHVYMPRRLGERYGSLS